MDVEVRLRDDVDFRDQILAWLRANDIDPSLVPARARASISDGLLTLPIYVRTAKGQLFVDPSTDAPARHTVTVPVKVAPPPDVQLWLTPRCETCGR